MDLELSALRCTGADTVPFLQGQLTCNVATLTEPQWCACCNPKGRVVASGWLQRPEPETVVWWLPANMLERTRRHLTRYVLRSKVTLDTPTLSPPTIPERAMPFIWVIPATSEQFTPHMLGYDHLGAIAWDKGCFVGQESIARTHHLGQIKRRPQRMRTTQAERLQAMDPIWPSPDATRPIATVAYIQPPHVIVVGPLPEQSWWARHEHDTFELVHDPL